MSLIVTPPLPLLQEELIGSAKGYYPNRSFDFVLGRNSVVNNVRVDLWEGPTGTYVFPAAAQQMHLASTSANDTLAGTGVQKVLIHYLDANYAVQQEIVSMNGPAGVNTVATNILRINGMHAVQVGAGGVSAGNISLTNLAVTVTYGFILASFNTARQAIYTVPAGKTGYITHWQAGSGTTTGTHFTQVDVRATSHAGILYAGTFLNVDTAATLNSGLIINLPIPIPIPATADVKMSAISDAAAANAIVTGSIMGWLE